MSIKLCKIFSRLAIILSFLGRGKRREGNIGNGGEGRVSVRGRGRGEGEKVWEGEREAGKEEQR